jgi:hypothetical protein
MMTPSASSLAVCLSVAMSEVTSLSGVSSKASR